MKKFILALISFLLHLIAVGLIIYLIWPIAKWYLEIKPVRGVDLYLSASFVSHLWKYFSFRFNGWKEFWYSGMPYSQEYPTFYFYLMVPFAKYFGLIPGIQRFAIGGLFVFATFSYLLYYQLSKNRILAVALALATLFSTNLYRALVWAGGIPFWTTQAFFPLVMFLIVKFCQRQNYKWLFLAALATGLGVLGHPQSFMNVIFPSAALLLIFWQPGEEKFSFKKRLLDLFKFGTLIILVGLPFVAFSLPSTLGNLFQAMLSPSQGQVPTSSGGTVLSPQMRQDIEAWTRSQFKVIWTDSSQFLWYLLVAMVAVFTLSLLFRKKRLKALVSLIAFGLIEALIVGSIFLFSRGYNFVYITGWYKAFWPTLIGTGMLVALCWGEAKKIFIEREFWQRKLTKFLVVLGVVVINIALFGISSYFLVSDQRTIIQKVDKMGNLSSAFPEIMDVKTNQKELLVLKDQLKPKLMTDNPKDFRLYIIDATVNIWWSALEEMPLTRGYTDPPLTFEERWGLFWIDSVLGPSGKGNRSSLIEDWHTPENVADNNLRFLLDWYATKYLEGNHLSQTSSNFAANVTSDKFIEADEVVVTKGAVINRYEKDLPRIWSEEGQQSLHFYKVKSDLISPILMTDNAKPVLHVGSDDGYDTLSRFLGEVNLGPRKIVLVRGPKEIDQLSYEDLKNFETMIIYKYDYRNWDKAWGMIDEFVKKGGRVFIDTGAEVKESDSTKLPAKYPSQLPGIFPIARTRREDLGQNWEPEAAQTSTTAGVDFNQFSPLVFDNQPWNISHPITEEDLRENTTVILRQRGIPIVAESTAGKGKVIWSGFNLPYHAIRDYNPEEAKFLINLLSELTSLEESQVSAGVTWVSPRERLIEVNGERGVLFKEQAFVGWQANLGNKKLKIYKTGPTSPGFIYVKLPEGALGKVRFKFYGSFMPKLEAMISTLTILFILDYLLGGRIFIPFINRLITNIRKQFAKWWEREEEE